jgi:hypothetical protein
VFCCDVHLMALRCRKSWLPEASKAAISTLESFNRLISVPVTYQYHKTEFPKSIAFAISAASFLNVPVTIQKCVYAELLTCVPPTLSNTESAFKLFSFFKSQLRILTKTKDARFIKKIPKSFKSCALLHDIQRTVS